MSKEVKTTTISTTIEQLGLAKNEAVLYEILLSSAGASIPWLRSHSPFSRTMLYYILHNLVAYGLVIEVNPPAGGGKKTVYTAASPEKLVNFVHEREREFHQQKDLLQGVMGDLFSTYRLAHHQPGIKFFEGKSGIVEAYEELLALGQPIDSIEDKGEMAAFIPEYAQEFIKKRVKLGLKNRVVAPSANKINTTTNKELRETRTIPVADFPFTMDIKIAGSVVLITTLQENQAVAVRITHPLIATNFKLLFSFMWSHATARNNGTPATGTVVQGDAASSTIFN